MCAELQEGTASLVETMQRMLDELPPEDEAATRRILARHHRTLAEPDALKQDAFSGWDG